MSRYTGPKCRLCRREGVKLFLKGERCDSPKCALFRKQQAPGQHGTSRRRPSEYALQLREKQKIKRLYGVSEAKFRHYFEKASALQEDTGDVLLQLLERRLDNVVYRAGFAVSRAQARQLVGHGKINVNGKTADRPSLLVSVGDTIHFMGELPTSSGSAVPGWLVVGKDAKKAQVKKLSERDDVGFDINEHLIVEFYSR